MTTATDTTALDELCVNTIRTLSMDGVEKANSGHPGTPMALAPITYVLYTRVMKHNPADANWPDRDRFILSCGHASMLLYSMLYLTGYGLELDDLKNFRQVGSPTAGHPEYGDAAGIETTTGPLGQGIANAVGFAIAERMLAARLNRDGHELINHHTFTIASDGDLQEGVSGEASSVAGHLGLGRLIAFYDDNHISIEGDTELSFSEDVGKRYEGYGWHVQDLGEELDLDNIERATRAAMDVEDRPSLIIVRTHIAPGSPNKQDTHGAHGAPLGEEEVLLTKKAYGWPSEEPFFVPGEALEVFRECIDRGKQQQREWEERAAAYRKEHADAWNEWRNVVERTMPDGWDSDIPRVGAEEGGKVATRKSSNKAIQHFAARVPHLIGGSADLAPSTLTLIDDGGDVLPGQFDGRNLHFGIREHGMGAIVNGLVLNGWRAFGATFLIFSDYMRGAIRLSAVMGIPSVWVFTHDSIGVGEDGPTHQPIEMLPALRAVPNLHVVRPADTNETMLAWRHALRSTSTPTLMAFSRQGVPTLDPDAVPDDAIERGAYVLRDSDSDPDVILMGSGTEISIAVAAAELLEADGTAVRVVSMPCMDTFSEQDQAYRDQVLPPGIRARVSVEAASPFGWDRWVTSDGASVAMRGFGESGPQPAVYEHFGFTPENVAEHARSVMAGHGAPERGAGGHRG